MSLRPSNAALLLMLIGLGLSTGCGEDTDSKPEDTEAEPDDTTPEWVPPTDEDQDGWTPDDGDCDDNDPAVFPHQTEACNGVDDNCNDLVDEGYGDQDDDGLADCMDTEECDGIDNDGDGDIDEDFGDGDGDGVADCVDSEDCDGVDNDGDGLIDEGYDADSDGYTQCGDETTIADCDDADIDINPGATEDTENELDDDCDGLIDEDGWTMGDLVITEIMANPSAVSDLLGEWIEIENHAGHSVYLNGLELVSDTGGHVISSDDLLILEDGAIYVLGRSDSLSDNGGVVVDYVYTDLGLSNESDELFILAGEVVVDSVGWDDGGTMPDIDGSSMMLDPWWQVTGDRDDTALWCASHEPWETRSDNGSPGAENGSCPAYDHDEDGYSGLDGDCDDLDNAIYPGATEIWYDGVDTDCDGLSDYDADFDGYDSIDHGGDDCDDSADTVNIGQDETCDGVDNNCSGDETDASDTIPWYYDGDGDGDGDPAIQVDLCSAPSGYVATNTDCDDTNPAIGGTSIEIWYDGMDSDCDGLSDYDADLDGHDSSDYGGDDCDDDAAEVNPDADEYCDDLDNDCDGDIDEAGAVDGTRWYYDLDGDGDGDPLNYVDACDQPSGTVAIANDCDDTSPALFDCAVGTTQANPGLSCADIQTISPSSGTGLYWLDPDGDGDVTDAYQVYCDMDTYGGGWTYAYWVDAEHFDGTYANNQVSNLTAPMAINDQQDIWNAETELTVSEVIFGCTTQNDADSHYWYYADSSPLVYFAGSTTYSYVTDPSDASSTTAGACFSTHKAESSYGFFAIEHTSCGSCTGILYGMYHYTSSTGCNSTDTTYGTHASPWDSRTIQYPICGGSQTSNGTFFIAVR
jgi:hypothetical protein